MRARAPGKVVLSGSYSVLEGAPALVSAVDRYVVADTELPATFEAPEARAALGDGPLPHVNASATRQGDRKLGVGSSAAIVVASMAAVCWKNEPTLDEMAVADRIWKPAVRAHQRAQGGGSGIDVVTSAFGRTRRCVLVDGLPTSEAHTLPRGLCVELYAAPQSASTPHMLTIVRAWAMREPKRYESIMAVLSDAAEKAASAADVPNFVDALRSQLTHLAQMGDECGAAIVPPSLRALADRAIVQGVAVHPSGAGGGDIVLCVGGLEACKAWREELGKAGLERLKVSVHARGVHRVDSGLMPA